MEENTKILLVEDDQNFGDVLRSYLEMNDYDVTLATDGEAGLTQFQAGQYDLCLLDVMMPKKDGFTLAKDIRALNETVPIIFLTAKSMKEDVLEGFKRGADDYIKKPFDSAELLYRIQAVLKRTQNTTSQVREDSTEFQVGSFHFHYPTRILTRGDHKDKLSPKEAELFKMFCQYKNEVLPRSKALKEIWGEDNYFTARSMDVFVTKLRRYLKDDESIKIINIHGNGFQLYIEDEAAEA